MTGQGWLWFCGRDGLFFDNHAQTQVYFYTNMILACT